MKLKSFNSVISAENYNNASFSHSLWLQKPKSKQNHEQKKVNIQLDGVQSRQVHLHEPILPVNSGDPVVMDASWYVTKLFPIFPKAVVLVIHGEWARGSQLQIRQVLLAPESPSLSPEQCSLLLNASGVASHLTPTCCVRGILVLFFFPSNKKPLLLDVLHLWNKAVNGEL